MVSNNVNPDTYTALACCDLCGLPNLPQHGEFFHCRVCSFDTCCECAASVVRYKLDDGVVEVMQDTSAIMAKGAGRPSPWPWRVWAPATLLARYFETRAQPANTKLPVALELGAGAGLTSLVLAKLGNHQVIATDVRDALPILREGVRQNFPDALPLQGGAPTSQANSTNSSCPQCPSHHNTFEELTCDVKWSCGVCRGTDVGGSIRCTTCEFTLCKNCADCARSGDFSSLPSWFRVQCHGSRSVVGEAFRMKSGIFLAWPLDWRFPAEFDALQAKAEELDLPPPALIFATDVAYDPEVVDALVSALVRLRDNWIRPSSHRAQLVLANESRGLRLEKQLIRKLRAQGICAHRATSLTGDASDRSVDIYTAEL